MNKIIGFAVTKNNFDSRHIDVFGTGLHVVRLQKNGLILCLWGIGDIEQCWVDNKYSMAFPLHNSLLDRNVLIDVSGDSIIIENDWLGSIPIFYNKKEKIVSTLCLETLRDKKLDNEGLSDYLQFGYSVFEHTMFDDVEFLRYFSKIAITADCCSVIYKDDPAEARGLFNDIEDADRVLLKIKKYINEIEANIPGDIVIPTSGGYDSRLLNCLIRDKKRILSFSHGISKLQMTSREVVYAKKLSECLQTRWRQIEIGRFYDYLDQWFKLYGFSVHLHGMYHVEFFKKIKELLNKRDDVSFLSGIIGDAWAGRVKIARCDSYMDLLQVGYTHGIGIRNKYLRLKVPDYLKKIFFSKTKESLKNEKFRIITAMRFKLLLLSYHMTVPEYLGFPVWTPFLSFDIAISMLNVEKSMRKNRLWQKKYFQKEGLDFERMKLRHDNNNCLNYQAFCGHSFKPIDVTLIEAYLDKKYILAVNREMVSRDIVMKIKHELLSNRYIRYGAKKIFGIKDVYSDYLVIKPVENALRY